MNLKTRIELLVKLGEYITQNNDELQSIVHKAHAHNQWFTVEHIYTSLNSIREQFLMPEQLNLWVTKYQIDDIKEPKKVGIVMAGNIPLVGFHDLLSCFVAGHIALMKTSSKDEILIPFIIKKLTDWNEESEKYFDFVDQLLDIEAVIATGSNNSAKHFEHYFAKYPNIIRKNRNGIAIIEGNETKDEMIALGKDIFSYFGLGCRNVSKLYIPEHFDIKILIEVMHDHYKQVVMHHKYKNNFDYNYAIYLMNKDNFLMSGSLIWRENPTLTSRIACIHYEKYNNLNSLEEHLLNINDQIQCIVGHVALGNLEIIPFGSTQTPNLNDYADGVDTMAFFKNLT